MPTCALPHPPRRFGAWPRRAALAAAATLLAACGKDPVAPGPIGGSYTATTFLLSQPGGETVDVLAEGATLDIVIAPDNTTTTGTLLIPASLNEGEVFTADMAGTAVRTGNRVRFQQASDTFVRNLVWTVGEGTLTSRSALGGANLDITLTRQP